MVLNELVGAAAGSDEVFAIYIGEILIWPIDVTEFDQPLLYDVTNIASEFT